MILVRLKRRSAKNNLTYAVVVTSSTVSPKSNQFIEKIGYYNPIVDKWSNKYLFIDFDRLKFWVERGACVNISLFILLRSLFAFKQYFSWETKIYERAQYCHPVLKIKEKKFEWN